MEEISNNEIWQKRTFIMSTNNLGLLKYASRVILIEEGRIVEIAPPEKIKELKEFKEMVLLEENHQDVY